MNFSVFSEAECRARYARADNKPYMLRVLAELTASTESDMAEFLGIDIASTKKINGTKAYEHYKMGKNDTAIAKSLGVSAAAICKWRQMRGLPSNAKACNKKIPSDDVMLEAYGRGLIDREIAAELNICETSVCRWRKRNNLKPNKKGRKK